MNIIYIATSLDGYIARLDEKCDFLKDDNSEPDNVGTYQKFYDSIDEIVMGANTYRQITEVLSPNNWPYDKKSYILSQSINKKINSDHIEIINSFEKLLPKIKNKKIWLCGGSQLIKLFWENQLIDQLVISIIPVVLGKGKPLFKNFSEQTLTLENVITYNGIVECYYQINWY